MCRRQIDPPTRRPRVRQSPDDEPSADCDLCDGPWEGNEGDEVGLTLIPRSPNIRTMTGVAICWDCESVTWLDDNVIEYNNIVWDIERTDHD